VRGNDKTLSHEATGRETYLHISHRRGGEVPNNRSENMFDGKGAKGKKATPVLPDRRKLKGRAARKVTLRRKMLDPHGLKKRGKTYHPWERRILKTLQSQESEEDRFF